MWLGCLPNSVFRPESRRNALQPRANTSSRPAPPARSRSPCGHDLGAGSVPRLPLLGSTDPAQSATERRGAFAGFQRTPATVCAPLARAQRAGPGSWRHPTTCSVRESLAAVRYDLTGRTSVASALRPTIAPLDPRSLRAESGVNIGLGVTRADRARVRWPQVRELRRRADGWRNGVVPAERPVRVTGRSAGPATSFIRGWPLSSTGGAEPQPPTRELCGGAPISDGGVVATGRAPSSTCGR